jgi:glycosyltransferase involved in cell wall biosynthesis
MNCKINYSIIIPHKNTPKLLKRCLDSIPRRNDVQIIVVDDNSDPDIVDFENFPGLNDPFVEVIFTKEGKGGGYARNVGLTKAAGKWLLFADADDFFNYCINDILDEYVNSNSDIVYFKHNCVDSEKYTPANRCEHFIKYIDYWLLSKKKADVLLRYRHTSVWARLHKTELIRKYCISFDEVMIANDVTFAYLTGFYASSIHADIRILYCTTIRQGSIRHTKESIEMKIDNFYVCGKRYLFYKKNKIPLSADISYIGSLFYFLFFSKETFKKAIYILNNLGYTSGEIKRLCIYNILIYTPINKLLKLFLLPKKMMQK